MKYIHTMGFYFIGAIVGLAAPIAPELEHSKKQPEPIRAESLKRSGTMSGIEDGLKSPAFKTDERAGRNIAALARGQAFLEAMEAQDEAVDMTNPPAPPPGTNDNIQVEILRRMQEDTSSPATNTEALIPDTAGSWALKGNAGLKGRGFLGTLDNTPFRVGVNGRNAIQITPTPFSPTLVMGASNNHTGEGVAGAVISGGGDQFFPNRIFGDYSVVGGGVDNQAGGKFQYLSAPFTVVGGGRGNLAERRNATVGGGLANKALGVGSVIAGGGYNTAEGEFSAALGGASNIAQARFSAIAGGNTNRVEGRAGFIGGGESNEARGMSAFIGGGEYNIAAGAFSIVPGGSSNMALGKFSMAAGRQARAEHEGSFVWSDSSELTSVFASTAPHQFLIRATGNVGIDTASPEEKLSVAGNVAPARSNQWTLGSNRLVWNSLFLNGTIHFADTLTFQGPKGVVATLDADGKFTFPDRQGFPAAELKSELVKESLPLPPAEPPIETTALRARLDQLATELQSSQKALAGLSDIQTQVRWIQSRLGEMEAQAKTVQSSANNRPTDPSALSSDIQKLNQEITQLRDKGVQLAQNKEALVTSLTETGKQISQIQQQMHAMGVRVEKIESTIQSRPVTSSNSVQNLHLVEAQLREVRGDFAKAIEALAERTQEQTTKEITELRNTLNALSASSTHPAHRPENEAAGMATVAGGSGNRALGTSSFIGGGYTNVTAEAFAAILGGAQNKARGKYSSIAGGSANTTEGLSSHVAGGRENQALGAYSTTLGGRDNLAKGEYSLAAGRRAKAIHKGSLVWGDSTDQDITSSHDNQVVVRAAGGISLASSSTLTSGVELPGGASAWSVRCETVLKHTFQDVNPLDSLARVVAMPIRSFSLHSQPDTIRHIGPVAEDFHTLFPYGEDHRLINTSDLDGITLSAIQGLNQKLEEKDRELKRQQAEIEQLKEAVKVLHENTRTPR